MEAEKVYRMKLSKIYPLLIAKAERKGRTKEEVDRLIRWLTGYDEAGLARQLEGEVDYGTFFREDKDHRDGVRLPGGGGGGAADAADPLPG